jgi:tRNA threonylcarbamoyladenosine biosynthesis protein TsaE
VSSDLEFRSGSAEETQAIGRQLAGILPPNAVVLLIGNLGAGKTTLTKGIAEGRGAAKAEEVSSPTFTLIHEYGDPVRVYHIDLYRLDTAAQVAGIGLEELFERPALVLVEWGERFRDFFPADRVEIRIEDQGADRRRIEVTVSSFGELDGPSPAPRGQ